MALIVCMLNLSFQCRKLICADTTCFTKLGNKQSLLVILMFAGEYEDFQLCEQRRCYTYSDMRYRGLCAKSNGCSRLYCVSAWKLSLTLHSNHNFFIFRRETMCDANAHWKLQIFLSKFCSSPQILPMWQHQIPCIPFVTTLPTLPYLPHNGTFWDFRKFKVDFWKLVVTTPLPPPPPPGNGNFSSELNLENLKLTLGN